MTENDAAIEALTARVQEQGVEIALMRRALLSLGANTLAGGHNPPANVFLAWFQDQMNPPPVAASPAGDSQAPQPANQGSEAGTSTAASQLADVLAKAGQGK